MTLNIGDKAPAFNLQTDSGTDINLTDLAGKQFVLYFYPKDNTSGCTQEACDFRDNFSNFKKHGIEIFGVSRDSESSHTKFKEKHSLPFTLLQDHHGDASEAYGAINKKTLLGGTFLGVNRSTFLIDEQGLIRGIWRNVNANGHAEQILNEISQDNHAKPQSIQNRI